MTQDILTVGDIWAVDLSSLELLNAETKRRAEDSGARRIENSSAPTQQRKPLRAGAEGPANLVTSKAMSNTMAVSTLWLKHMLIQQQLQRGDGLFTIPASRRNERFMCTGRTKHISTGIKLEKLNVEMLRMTHALILARYLRESFGSLVGAIGSDRNVR